VRLFALGLAATGALLASPGVARAQGDWERVAPGVEYAARTTSVGRDSLTLRVVRVNPALARVRVVAVYQALQQHPGAYGYTLNEIVEATRPHVAINGGFSTSFSVPLPAGLLRIDSRTVKALSARDSVLTGVLCLRAGHARIVRREAYVAAECVHAVQAGPLLVDGSATVNVRNLARARSAVRRSVAALDRQGRLLLIITGPVRLDSLAGVLARDEHLGGLAATVALNLDGDTHSALFVKRAAGPTTSGTPQVPIASVILVQ